MIEKLKQTIRGFDDKPSMPTAIEFFNKINEIIELLNAIVVDVDGIKCVDGSKKPEPADPYAEQRKALDVAKDALKNIGTSYPRITDIAMQDKANKALEQIKALNKGK